MPHKRTVVQGAVSRHGLTLLPLASLGGEKISVTTDRLGKLFAF